jgi:hypothetical protein
MIIFQGKRDFKNTPKVFTELAGLYYAAQYIDNVFKGSGTVFIFKTGNIYDIAVAKKKNRDLKTIKKEADFFIEVKGMATPEPTDFRVNKTIDKLTNNIKENFLFYIVYNIGLNKKPGLAILDWIHFKDISNFEKKDGTYHVHNVNENVKNGEIPNFPNKLKTLDINTKKIILNSFKDGRFYH